MKHIVIDLNNMNKLIMFSNSILGNFFFDTFFGELEAKLSPLTNLDKQYELLHTTQIVETHCNIVDTYTKVDSNNCTHVVSSSTIFFLELTDPHIWTIYFDGLRNKEGTMASCLLLDPHGNKTILACCLEFDCTNNVVEYEEFVQGLIKSLDFQVKCIEVFGDSQVVVWQVRN